MCHTGVIAVAVFLFPSNPGMLKDSRKRSAAAVRERIRSTLTVVRDESPNGHGLHRMVDDVHRPVINTGRDAWWSCFNPHCFEIS